MAPGESLGNTRAAVYNLPAAALFYYPSSLTCRVILYIQLPYGYEKT
jgi:hypothetical protein